MILSNSSSRYPLQQPSPISYYLKKKNNNQANGETKTILASIKIEKSLLLLLKIDWLMIHPLAQTGFKQTCAHISLVEDCITTIQVINE